MSFVDILLRKNTEGYYDLDFDNGDLYSTDGFTSALLISIFCERRATPSEVAPPEKRRGWWGNAFLGFADFEMGSKLWLLSQARADQVTLNNSITFTNNAVEWFKEDKYIDKANVTANYDEQNALLIFIQFLIGQDIVLNKGLRLWNNTIEELSEELT
jgi:phage gp46-like protein